MNIIIQLISTTRQSFQDGKTLSYEFRLHQLKQLRQLVIDNAAELIKAGQKDMYRRSEEELQREEIQLSIDEITILIDNLESYTKDVHVHKDPELEQVNLLYTIR